MNGLLTARDAAKYVGVCDSIFNNLVRSGQIGFKKIGKTKRFTEEELKRWLEKIDYHTDFSSVEKYSTRTSHLKPKPEKIYSFEKVQEQITKMKPKDIVL